MSVFSFFSAFIVFIVVTNIVWSKTVLKNNRIWGTL